MVLYTCWTTRKPFTVKIPFDILQNKSRIYICNVSLCRLNIDLLKQRRERQEKDHALKFTRSMCSSLVSPRLSRSPSLFLCISFYVCLQPLWPEKGMCVVSEQRWGRWRREGEGEEGILHREEVKNYQCEPSQAKRGNVYSKAVLQSQNTNVLLWEGRRGQTSPEGLFSLDPSLLLLPSSLFIQIKLGRFPFS